MCDMTLGAAASLLEGSAKASGGVSLSGNVLNAKFNAGLGPINYSAHTSVFKGKIGINKAGKFYEKGGFFKGGQDPSIKGPNISLNRDLVFGIGGEADNFEIGAKVNFGSYISAFKDFAQAGGRFIILTTEFNK